ncbi:coenzyme F420-0:L-glutamate ligase [Thermoleophilia bacterium SCSIO 60948]|nr:coenzyme F420-0:L-glutamate ligase [Thermoleophilia bacterium SCSIO 60948]
MRAEPIPGLPEVEEGDPLGRLIAAAATRARIELGSASVVCVSQKVVSKAEGRVLALGDVVPGPGAIRLAGELGKDPALVELVLAESRSVLRAERGALICETHSGLVCANAGIDASNVPGENRVALLPADPDDSARRLRSELRAELGAPPAVVISDSFGRAWRLGQAEIAIGCAGLAPLDDLRGELDRDGRELAASAIAVADQLASAADLARHKRSGTPAVVISGADRWITSEDGPGAAALRRPEAEDLFR